MTETVYAIHAAYGGKAEGDSYLSRPLDSTEYPAVVLLHEWWGLDKFHRELTRDLAREGYVVITPHLYGRETVPTEDPHEAGRRKIQLNLERAVAEIESAINFTLDSPLTADSCAVTGFCMGGGLALLALGELDVFDAGVIYYPSIYPEKDHLKNIHSQLQFHSGSRDYPTHRSELKRIKEGLTEIRQQLDEFDKPYDYYEYEGAEHAFMNPEHSYYDEEAAELSWERTLSFLDDQLSDSSA